MVPVRFMVAVANGVLTLKSQDFYPFLRKQSINKYTPSYCPAETGYQTKTTIFWYLLILLNENFAYEDKINVLKTIVFSLAEEGLYV